MIKYFVVINLSKKLLKIFYTVAIIGQVFICSSCYMKELHQSLEDIFWWRSYNTIINRPVSAWNRRDCLTVMMENIRSNLLDNHTNIKVYVTPYTPAVIAAISKFHFMQLPLPPHVAESNFESLLKETFGMYYDRENEKIMDSRGNYFKNKLQIDSLLFLITIENNAWMNSMAFGHLLDIPDITSLENQIFLVNDENKYILPKYVWGRNKNILTTPEVLFVNFKVREGDYSFLEKSKNIYLCIKGFEQDIRLEFPLKHFEELIKLH